SSPVEQPALQTRIGRVPCAIAGSAFARKNSKWAGSRKNAVWLVVSASTSAPSSANSRWTARCSTRSRYAAKLGAPVSTTRRPKRERTSSSLPARRRMPHVSYSNSRRRRNSCGRSGGMSAHGLGATPAAGASELLENVVIAPIERMRRCVRHRRRGRARRLASAIPAASWDGTDGRWAGRHPAVRRAARRAGDRLATRRGRRARELEMPDQRLHLFGLARQFFRGARRFFRVRRGLLRHRVHLLDARRDLLDAL